MTKMKGGGLGRLDIQGGLARAAAAAAVANGWYISDPASCAPWG